MSKFTVNPLINFIVQIARRALAATQIEFFFFIQMDFTSTSTTVVMKTDVTIRVIKEKGWKTVIEGLSYVTTGKKTPEELLTHLKKTVCFCNGNIQSEFLEEHLSDEENATEAKNEKKEKKGRKDRNRNFTIENDADFSKEKDRDSKKEKPSGPIFYVLHGDHRQTLTRYLESVGCKNIKVVGGKS